jgi:hypothetical protein
MSLISRRTRSVFYWCKLFNEHEFTKLHIFHKLTLIGFVLNILHLKFGFILFRHSKVRPQMIETYEVNKTWLKNLANVSLLLNCREK